MPNIHEVAAALRELADAVDEGGNPTADAGVAVRRLEDAVGQARSVLYRYDLDRLPGYAY